MIWFICAITALVLMALGLKLYANEKNGVSRVVLVLGCLLVATYVVYIPPFTATYGTLPGAIGGLVHVLGVAIVDSDIMQFYDTIVQGINNEMLAYGYIALLGVVHIVLPTVTALTAVAVLFRCFTSVQLLLANRRKRPVFIFSEANDRAMLLAKSLEQIKCDIVFADDSDDSTGGDIGDERGVIFKEEGIPELRVKSRKGKEVYFFCIAEDEDLSLSHTLQLIEKYTKIKEEDQSHIHIYLFSKSQDFSVFIDSADKGALDVQCINEYELLIYRLLDQYPLFKGAKEGVHVLLHGLSDINVIALRAIAWCGQISGLKLRISVVGTDLAHRINDLQLAFPGLFTDRYDIRFYDCDHENQVVQTIEKKCKDASYIIVSEETDNATMEKGILLRRLFYKLDEGFAACPPIFCYIKDPAKAKLVKQLATAESNPARKMNYDLIPFGSLEEVFTYEALVNSDIEKLAKNVHLAYEEIFSDGQIDVKEALKRYSIFEVNKRSNRANALHIRYKLRLLGLDYTLDETAQAVSLENCYTEQSLEAMAISEHDRWMAFLETEGWIPSSREDVLAYRQSGISKGRHNCPILKMHPYICEYEKLKDLSLELENKDTTVYDRELIARIPDILGDKWGVSGRKYKIVKMD